MRSNDDDMLIPVWVVVNIILSLLVAMVSGLLSYSQSHDIATALAVGGSVFLLCGTFGLAIINTLRRPH